MQSTACPAGIARRTETFPELEATARDVSAPGVTTAAVTGLVLRGVKVLTPALTPAAVHLLALLVEHVHGDDRWRLGRLRVVPSNARLAAMMGTCERGIRRLLSLLEANHWIVRRYTASNRRSRSQAGIDLAPVAARRGSPTCARPSRGWRRRAGRPGARRTPSGRMGGQMSPARRTNLSP